MKTSTIRRITLALAAVAVLGVAGVGFDNAAFAANQTGHGHSEPDRGVSGMQGNQGNGPNSDRGNAGTGGGGHCS